jgi:hypothetical protein
MSMAGRSPASEADLETGLLPRPQFETELGGQRPVRSQQQWAEISSAQAGFNGQLHETSDLQDVEFFKGASGGHICVSNGLAFRSRDSSLLETHGVLHSGYSSNVRTGAVRFGAVRRTPAFLLRCAVPPCRAASMLLLVSGGGADPMADAAAHVHYAFRNASRSALMVSASVVGMPCGKPL